MTNMRERGNVTITSNKDPKIRINATISGTSSSHWTVSADDVPDLAILEFFYLFYLILMSLYRT